MPKPVALVDYGVCCPEKCPEGICLAVQVCERKVLRQEARGEAPFCLGLCTACGTCVTACPHKAIRLA